jgi:hypothetical protein
VTATGGRGTTARALVAAAALDIASALAGCGPGHGRAEDEPDACTRTAAPPDGPGEVVTTGPQQSVTLGFTTVRLVPVESAEDEACAVRLPDVEGSPAGADGVLSIGESFVVDVAGTRATLLAVRAASDGDEVDDVPGSSGPVQADLWVTYPAAADSGCAVPEETPPDRPGQVVALSITQPSDAGVTRMPRIASDGCAVVAISAERTRVWWQVGERWEPGAVAVEDERGDGVPTVLPVGSTLLSVDLTADPGVFELRVWVPDAG